MKRHLIVISSTLMLMTACTQANEWKTQKPYQDNSLTTATLSGSGTTKRAAGNTWLTVACRADAPPASVTLRVDGALAKTFPTELFEGPGATGEKARLVSIKLGDSALQRSWYSTGSFQEDSHFEWTFMPQKTELTRWLSSPGKPLTVYITAPGKVTQTLTASFTLPQTMKGASETLAPCLK